MSARRDTPRSRRNVTRGPEWFVAYAAGYGGTLVSKHPPGRVKHLDRVRFRCKQGHEWDSLAGQVIQKATWCFRCRCEAKRKPIDDLATLAADRGGAFIRLGANRGRAAVWRCAKGHEFNAVPDAVKRGGWCPTCSAARPERIVRSFFEQIFGKPFPRMRPAWLRNTTGHRLELDGFCEDLKLAFEHHGEQHYTDRKGRFAGQTSAIRQRDLRKRRLCSERGVVLIEIPDLLGRVKLGDLKATIISLCDGAGVPVPPAGRRRRITPLGVYSTSQDDEGLEKLCVIAAGRGGKCLSTRYLGSTHPLMFQCEKGHKWKIRPQDITSGSWCMKCARVELGLKTRLGIDEARRIAASRGGECLSHQYRGANELMRWRCGDCGHEWEAPVSRITKRSWCPPCAYRGGWERRRKRFGKSGQKGRPGRPSKYSIEDMRRLAKERGGECLSSVYLNEEIKLRWRCGDCGHEWESAPAVVARKGTWCPPCGHRRGAKLLAQRRARSGRR
jgi:hypothetical protein